LHSLEILTFSLLFLKNSDSYIIDGCKQGNRDAQTELFMKYKSMLFGVCLRYAQHRQEAEDLLQEGMIVIYRDLYQYKPIGALGAWLRRVMVNVCLQHIRKRNRIIDTTSLEKFGEQFETDEDLFSQFRARALVKMIQKLPPGYRMVFNLYVLEGNSHQEIADLLGISINTSKSQLSRAKATLRKMLEKKFVDES
jgi:RNA polymerase sigma-70 factor (ECF subfamily)